MDKVASDSTEKLSILLHDDSRCLFVRWFMDGHEIIDTMPIFTRPWRIHEILDFVLS